MQKPTTNQRKPKVREKFRVGKILRKAARTGLNLDPVNDGKWLASTPGGHGYLKDKESAIIFAEGWLDRVAYEESERSDKFGMFESMLKSMNKEGLPFMSAVAHNNDDTPVWACIAVSGKQETADVMAALDIVQEQWKDVHSETISTEDKAGTYSPAALECGERPEQFAALYDLAMKAKTLATNRATKGPYIDAGFNCGMVWTPGKEVGVIDSHFCDIQEMDEAGGDSMSVMLRGWGEAVHTPDPEAFMNNNMAYLLGALNDYPKLAAACLMLIQRIATLEGKGASDAQG